MPQFATFDELKGIARRLNVRAVFNAARRKTGKTVFLSHSSKDAELLPAVIVVLEEHGGKVYVDLADDELPRTPSKETGRILRTTISDCRKFVLFVTPNSRNSPWAPWELGVADGEKSPRSLALFPSAATSWETSWAGQEYLGLYNRIVWGRIKYEPNSRWLVFDHHRKRAMPLENWLRRSDF